MPEEKRLSQFKGVKIIPDEKLSGEKYGEMVSGEDEIRVSPAMYALLQSDPEVMLQRLKVKILPK